MEHLIPAPQSSSLSSWAGVSDHLLQQLLRAARRSGYAPTVRDGATYPTLLLIRSRRTARVYLAIVDGGLRWHWETTREPLQAPATDTTLVLAEIARALGGDR